MGGKSDAKAGDELEDVEKTIRERKEVLKELNREVFEYEAVLQKRKKKVGKYKGKIEALRTQLSIFQNGADSP